MHALCQSNENALSTAYGKEGRRMVNHIVIGSRSRWTEFNREMKGIGPLRLNSWKSCEPQGLPPRRSNLKCSEGTESL
ncbi:MAG: hypothetical protein KatS3mg111_3777 [Pirellulaceae bacterium]|nr:MAG: hypothetical protein KatS3mg111_3777 [Pirellulaceae bacterium]